MTTIAPRFLVHLPKEVQEAVEDFRFSRRMESRSAAIRELIKLGLQAAAAGEVSPRKSSRRP
jgi:metal-responsive CopG/Arc/MetJ family transcriptional regulator